MLIRRGWAVRYAERKFDVEIDEADLARMLAGAGVRKEDLADVLLHMKTEHVYLIMDSEAMAFVHDTLRRAAEDDDERRAHAAKVREFRATRDETLAIYAPVPETAPA
jgi:RNA-binding protein YlmH